MIEAAGSRGVRLDPRAARPARIFLTGGTGFLGSHLAAALLARGCSVWLLARPLKGRTAGGRVAALMEWLGLPAAARRGLRVVEGDITRPGLGMAPAARDETLRDTDEIIHCASNTSFSERKRAEVEMVNLDGLSRVLEFAAAGRARFFHHVSTVFVAGVASGRCLEEPAVPGRFHNAYEETKCRGERMAAAACGEAGLPLAIYRPSIVYGDSRTGRSLLFNALYYPVRIALFLRDLYEKGIRETGGETAAKAGVDIAPDGRVRLPLRIEAPREGGVNLIPVDYFTDAFLSLMEGAEDGDIFHIVNGRETRVEELVEYTSRLLAVTGIRACQTDAFEGAPRNAVEKLFERYVEPYLPYMKDTRRFDSSNARPLLERSGVRCPEFCYGIFERCMRFAIESAWRSPAD